MEQTSMPLSKNSQQVQDYLDRFGLKLEVRELLESTRTAQDAANAVGCDLGQIVKSLIFKAAEKPILFLVSGKNRLDEDKVGEDLGIRLEKADADFVREKSGFPIGGVPPVAHAVSMEIYIDSDLMGYAEVWAAAGTPNAVFRIKSSDLPRVTGGRTVEVK
jgi:prolyl-tRNA editing enzyme YbaK/EbsC (Cys-tRNA(Pro) deacylase)